MTYNKGRSQFFVAMRSGTASFDILKMDFQTMSQIVET